MDKGCRYDCRTKQDLPIYTTMRLTKVLLRFATIAAMVVAMAAPAMAIVVTSLDDQTDILIANAARQPVFHRTQSSGNVLGTLRIPAIGLDETVRSGVAMSVIDLGVAHWSGTATPGENGNVVLAGHRTTKTKPFLNLDKLKNGDIIYITDGSGFEVMYRVSSTIIVEPEALWITYDSPTPTLTMFACHPKRSAKYRIVVKADLVGGRNIT